MSNRDAGRRFLLGQVCLKDFFESEDQMANVFAAIQRKLVSAMLKAENSKGRCTGAGHYITGVGGRINLLARMLVDKIGRLDYEYGLDALPVAAKQLSRSQQRQVVDMLHFEVISTILAGMNGKGHLYYMEGDGDWMFSDVICRDHNHAAREAKQAWRDNRALHGRPENQGRRRDSQLRQAPAQSGGYSKKYDTKRQKTSVLIASY